MTGDNEFGKLLRRYRNRISLNLSLPLSLCDSRKILLKQREREGGREGEREREEKGSEGLLGIRSSSHSLDDDNPFH